MARIDPIWARVTDSGRGVGPYLLHQTPESEKETEMLVDTRLAKTQTDYKRAQLARSFRSKDRERMPRAKRRPRQGLKARKPSVA